MMTGETMCSTIHCACCITCLAGKPDRVMLLEMALRPDNLAVCTGCACDVIVWSPSRVVLASDTGLPANIDAGCA